MKSINLKRLLLPLAIFGLILPCLSSCDDDNNAPGSASFPTVFNIVTLRNYNPTGGMVFTFRTGATTPLITLTTPLSFDTAAVKAGQRVLIGYNTPDSRPDTVSGPIELINYRLVYNDTIRKATQQVVESYNAAPLTQAQAWRTGNFINAMGMIPYYGSPLPNIVLYADEASIQDGTIDMYLTLDNIDTPPGQRIDSYSSFDIRRFIASHNEVHTFRIFYTGCQGQPIIIPNVYPLPE